MTKLFIAALAVLIVINAPAQTNRFEYREGGIIRGPKDRKRIALEFTADTFSNGAATVLDALEQNHVEASFFLTGNFFRKKENKALIDRIVKGRHYVGPHSDTHPLLCPWEGEKKTLIGREAFDAEVEKNIKQITKVGIERAEIKYWIPPYEWYNMEISNWSREAGVTLINFTPGTRSPADYTENDAKNFVPAETIYKSIIDKEKKDGLNGFLLLLHFGVSPKRTDLMANRLSELILCLKERGYEFVRVDELLAQ